MTLTTRSDSGHREPTRTLGRCRDDPTAAAIHHVLEIHLTILGRLVNSDLRCPRCGAPVPWYVTLEIRRSRRRVPRRTHQPKPTKRNDGIKVPSMVAKKDAHGQRKAAVPLPSSTTGRPQRLGHATRHPGNEVDNRDAVLACLPFQRSTAVRLE